MIKCSSKTPDGLQLHVQLGALESMNLLHPKNASSSLQVLSVNISLHDSIGVHTLRWPPHPINCKSQKLLHEGKKNNVRGPLSQKLLSPSFVPSLVLFRLVLS